MPEVRLVHATDEALLVGTYKEFLPESKGHAGGALGVAKTPEAVGRLPTGGGVRKVVGLVSPEDGAEREVYVAKKVNPCLRNEEHKQEQERS